MPRKDKQIDERNRTTEDIEKNSQAAEEGVKQEQEAGLNQEPEFGENNVIEITDEQYQIDHAYADKKEANKKAYAEHNDMDEFSFLQSAKENGWVFEPSETMKKTVSDEIALTNLYKTAMESGDERLWELCDKILGTNIDTAEKRNQFVTEVQKETEKVLETNKTLSTFAKADLRVVADRTRALLSEKEFEPVKEKIEAYQKQQEEIWKAYTAMQKAEAEAKKEMEAFTVRMMENGWHEEHKLYEKMYREYHDKIAKANVSQEFKDAMKAQLDKIENTKLDADTPLMHQNQLLKDFTTVYKKYSYGTGLEYDAEIFKLNSEGYNQDYHREAFEKEKAFLYRQRREKESAIIKNARENLDSLKKEAAPKERQKEQPEEKGFVTRLLTEEEKDRAEVEKVRKNPEARQKALDEFPFTQKEYEKASTKERVEKLKEYFLILVSDRVPVEKARKAISDETANAVFLETVTKAKQLDTCKKAIDGVFFEEAALGKVIRNIDKNRRAQSKADYEAYHLADALRDEDAFFKKNRKDLDEKRKLKAEAQKKEREKTKKKESQTRLQAWSKSMTKSGRENQEIVEKVRETAQRLNATIDEVDFNMLRMGSGEFRDMKAAVKDLAVYSMEQYGN